MELAISVTFDPHSPGGPGTDERAFFDAFPRSPAVFALFFDDAGKAQPYLSRTADLRRRLLRLLGRRELAAPEGQGFNSAGPALNKEITENSQMRLLGMAEAAPAPGLAQPPGVAAARRSMMLNLRGITRRISYQRVGSNFEARWLLYQLNRQYYPQSYRQRLRLRPPPLLKVNLRNRFPRCYPTRRPARDGSLYYGPFPSRIAAERYAAEFLDLFKIRRCVEDLDPDPSHPGCIYSQMQMCLAPCFKGCTDAEYQDELRRVTDFLDSEGRTLVRALEAEREQASGQLAFEEAAKTHRRIEKVQEVLRLKPGLARNLSDLHALILERGAEPKSVAFFLVVGGELRGPGTLSLEENVASPVPLDQQLRDLLATLAPGEKRDSELGTRDSRKKAQAGIDRNGSWEPEVGSRKEGRDIDSRFPAPDPRAASGESGSSANPEPRIPNPATPKLPPWEHLALLSRWYYSSFREGEIVLLSPNRTIPHARIIRLCRKMLEVGDAR